MSPTMSSLRKPNVTVFMVVKDVLKKKELFQEVLVQASKISDQFYIVNHGSTDTTENFIREMTKECDFQAEIVNEPFDAGNMDEMKGKHYRQLRSRTEAGSGREYVFILDWDEVPSDALVNEIFSTELKKDVYMINRQTFFLGKVIDLWANLPLLFRPKWLEVWAFKKVHDLYRILSQSVGKLEQPLFHYSFENARDLIDKTRFYAEIESQELFLKYSKSSRILVGFRLFGRAWLYFWYSLFMCRNYRHVEGWVYAFWVFPGYLMQYMFFLEKLHLENPQNERMF